MQPMYPMSSPTTAPTSRPAPMRVFEGQVVDLRECNEDDQGRFLPLHLDDPNRFEVVSIASSNVGMKDLMKKEKVVPVFMKAHEDWNVALDRSEDVATLVPMQISM